MCGACGEVCPVRIPLPKLINHLRADAVNYGKQLKEEDPRGKGSLRKPGEALAWKIWQQLYGSPLLYKGFRWLATRLRRLSPAIPGWSKYRSSPRPAPKSLHELVKLKSQQHKGLHYE